MKSTHMAKIVMKKKFISYILSRCSIAINWPLITDELVWVWDITSWNSSLQQK